MRSYAGWRCSVPAVRWSQESRSSYRGCPVRLPPREGAVRFGAIEWIKLQPISWPYTTLRNSTGDDTLFWIFVALAAFGVWRQWRSARPVAELFALWTVGPILTVMVVTYLIHPLEFPRYVLVAFVGMFALAALGAASIPSTAVRIALAALLMYLSVGPVHERVRHSDGGGLGRLPRSRAAQLTMPGEQVAVFPPYCINVVRFYMPHERRDDVIGADKHCGSAAVLVISGFDYHSAGPIRTDGRLLSANPRRFAVYTGALTLNGCFVAQINPDHLPSMEVNRTKYYGPHCVWCCGSP